MIRQRMNANINNSIVPEILEIIDKRYGNEVKTFIEENVSDESTLLRWVDDIRELANRYEKDAFYTDDSIDSLVKPLYAQINALANGGAIAWRNRLKNTHISQIIFMEEAFSYGCNKIQGQRDYGGRSDKADLVDERQRQRDFKRDGIRHLDTNRDDTNRDSTGNFKNVIRGTRHIDNISTHGKLKETWIKEIKDRKSKRSADKQDASFNAPAYTELNKLSTILPLRNAF